ncbi:hypothetical protein [Mesobacillus foraminis]|uniref:hypothetical protein n=1 Tax=Mesobacillus foraminis TaxID=279826 RepID=UPI000EF4B64A|nr:hypothetical protein [Mesobacillus foraminis]
MMSLQDKLYNWLTIKVVTDERPNDTAASDTRKMFEQLLADEHGIVEPNFTTDEEMYYISVEVDKETKTYRFPRELIEVMLKRICDEPEKFVNYPES